MMFVRIGSHIISTTSQFTCAYRASGFYANPVDCSGYYICAARVAFDVKCAAGLHFNAKTKYCDWPRNAHCSSQNPGTQTHQNTQAPIHITQAPAQTTKFIMPITQAPKTNGPTYPWMNTNRPTQRATTQQVTQRPITNAPVRTTASPNIAPNNNNFCKKRPDGLYSDPKSCGFYYQCAFGLTFWEPCPTGLAFNDVQQACDWMINVPNCQIGG